MSDKERDKLLLELHASVELLRSTVAFLCTATLDDRVLTTYVETLDLPISGDGLDVHMVEKAKNRLLGDISKNRALIEKNRRKG